MRIALPSCDDVKMMKIGFRLIFINSHSEMTIVFILYQLERIFPKLNGLWYLQPQQLQCIQSSIMSLSSLALPKLFFESQQLSLLLLVVSNIKALDFRGFRHHLYIYCLSNSHHCHRYSRNCHRDSTLTNCTMA